MYLKPRGFAYL